MLATFTVTNLGDLNMDDEVIAGSLRAAVNNANDDDDPDIIVFADGLAGTVTLNGGQLNITQQVRILGPGPQKIGIQADTNSRIFDINIGADDEAEAVEISGVTLSGGNIVSGEVENRLGGAIWNRENLRMTEVIVSGNNAQRGGGGIYHEFGALTVSRSYFTGNTAGGGGAIQIGGATDESDNVPVAQIINSTFNANAAGGNGGAIYNRNGVLNVRNSTIVYNSASLGAGIAAYGNPVGEGDEPPPPPHRFTFVVSSILWGNDATGMDAVRMTEGGDLDEVGATEPDDEMPPVPLLSTVGSYGMNIIGVTNVPPKMMEDDLLGLDASDMIDVDPMLQDDGFGGPLFVGGSTPVYLPIADSPALDAGGYGPFGPTMFEQRGRHFVREFGDGVDIGAAEKQNGLFVVDLSADESDGQFSAVGLGLDPYVFGDFSIREAIDFSEANPEIDTIQFVDFRGDPSNPDLTISPAPTIFLTGGPLQVRKSVFIEGPSTHVLEIDASGNDDTPLQNNSDGTSVFLIDNGANASFSDILISNLSIIGADAGGTGGGIFNRENLTLASVTLRENYASNLGGGLYHQFGTLEISDSTFSGNTAGNRGGGLFIEGAASGPEVKVSNSTFSGNVVGDRGAGIANNNGKLALSYVTITANTAASASASGLNNSGAAASTSLYSTVVSGNANSNVAFSNSATINTFTSLGYNFIGGGAAAGKFIQPGDITNNNNPMLAPLAITGGLTATHRPLVGSPLIDAGDPAATAPEFDQRGPNFFRIFDGNNDTVPRIDIGAYELQPTVLVVDNDEDASDGDFSMGEFSLREAIELSNQNPLVDTIQFSPQLATITVGGVATTTMTITDSVVIEGPGSGDLAIVANPVDMATQAVLADKILTIDNGAASFIDVSITGLEFRNAQVGAIFSRENLTLDDISFFNNRSTTDGGALSHQLGAITLINNVATANTTTTVDADGGAFYFENVNGANKVEFDGVVISGNTTSMANSDGAGVYFKNTVAELRGTTISGNSTLAGAARAGAVFIDASTVTFEESTISGNSTVGANSEGGGLVVTAGSTVTLTKNTALNFNTTIGSQSPGAAAFVSGGTLTIDNSVVLQNSTAGLTSSGGAITLSGGTVNILGSAVLQNRVTGIGSNGGAVANLGGVLNARSSTFSANQATHADSRGGAIYSDTNLAGSQLTSILNSTISGNSAPRRGGGVFNADGRTEIRHSTVTNNSTPFMNAGNGVASLGNAATTLTVIESSIIAGNAGVGAGTGSDIDFVDSAFQNTLQSQGYNVIGVGNSLGNFNQPGDKTGITNPLLAPLAANGGLTDTHALLPGSVAINAGKQGFNANSFTPPLTTDQRGTGFGRVMGGRIDAGAFESTFTPFTADFDSDNDVDGGDFIVWQRNLGLAAGATKSQGDANGDGAVTAADLAAWRLQFGAVGSVAAAAPSSAAEAPAALAAVAPAIESPVAGPLLVSPPTEDAAASGSQGPAQSRARQAAPSRAEYVALAGAGTPGVGAHRSAVRAAVARAEQDAAFDAVHARHAFGRAWTLADDGLPSERPGAKARRPAAEGEAEDVSTEDVAFALLGEDVL
ncbi:MAG TPA: choice-of-anchor Q domain-containing protein [Lacipirellulaceae bacterium]|nr:choice-of-anchor Q domain-containing protein [Lacipirellulaceae bacterium]